MLAAVRCGRGLTAWFPSSARRGVCGGETAVSAAEFPGCSPALCVLAAGFFPRRNFSVLRGIFRVFPRCNFRVFFTIGGTSGICRRVAMVWASTSRPFAAGVSLMASFPGAKAHRRNRRVLGRGQYPPLAAPTLTVTASSADVMQIVASQPVVWHTPIAATVATRTVVSQAIVNQTTVQITFSGTVASLAYTVPAGAGTAYNGASTPAASGSF